MHYSSHLASTQKNSGINLAMGWGGASVNAGKQLSKKTE